MNNWLLKLKKSNLVIASHIFATGPALELEEYLYPKVKSLFFIGHPFSFRKDKNSFFRYYKEGKMIKEKKGISWKLPEIVIYIKELLLTIFWVLKSKDKIDLYIGSDNYLAFLGLILKRLGKVKDVILYTIDYVPNRFSNPLLNSLYKFFDKKCLEECLVVWNVSDEIAKAREKFNGVKIEGNSKQITVPLGIWYDRIPKLPLDKKDKNTIVFMGHILEKQGLDIVIKSLVKIKEIISDIKLIIIGTGDYEKNLKKLANDLNMENNVKFLGYVEDHKDLEKILTKSTVAVATYKPDPASFSYYADPGKIKNYLAAGLPVFLTEVPAIAKKLEEARCGVICKYDENDLAEKIIRMLSDKKMLGAFSKNAVLYTKEYDWNNVFSQALEKTLSRNK